MAPFGVFLLFLVLGPSLPLGRWEPVARAVALALVLGLVSRHVIRLRPERAWASIGIGALVFALWVAPDVIWPSWRAHWLFQNALTGKASSSMPEAWRQDALVLVFRTLRAVVLVPIIEELFWRAWMMRWLIRTDFVGVPMGAWAANAFWITALLFAAEHGPYWDVGLVAGIAYNGWMIRTRSLADCILAHAVTNGLLSGWVIFSGAWGYWL